MALKSEVTKFQKAAISADCQSRPSVGLGTDIRLESRNVVGFALALDERVFHLSVFERSDGNGGKVRESRMGRFAQRRRNRVQ